MKIKFLFCVLLATSLLALSSCSDDSQAEPAGLTDGPVTLSLDLSMGGQLHAP